jgi:hypothetical protein
MIASLCAYLGGEKLGKGTDRTSDVAVVTSSRTSQNSTLRASSLLRIDGVGEVSREGPAPVPAGEAGGILDPRGMPTAAANRRRAGGDGARVRREGRRNPHAPGKTEWGIARGASARARWGGRRRRGWKASRRGRRHPRALGVERGKLRALGRSEEAGGTRMRWGRAGFARR